MYCTLAFDSSGFVGRSLHLCPTCQSKTWIRPSLAKVIAEVILPIQNLFYNLFIDMSRKNFRFSSYRKFMLNYGFSAG